MRVQLRGLMAAGAGIRSVELPVPDCGIPLSAMLAQLRKSEPRLARYFDGPVAGAALRPVVNDRAVDPGTDPLVLEGDTVMLLMSVSGG